MKTIETYIFVHKQEIILEFKEKQRLTFLPNLKYVLVGKNNFNLVEGMGDVIVAKQYTDNIEDYPKFTSYTGWYVLWKNNLIQGDYVNLFEYDINVKPEINNIFKSIEKSNIDFIGYLPMSVKEPCYLQDRIWTNKMIESINKNYSVNMDQFFSNFIKNNPHSVWSSTSNCTFSNKSFNDYMNWFLKIFEDLKDFDYPGHAHERSLSFFYFLKKLKVQIFPGFIDHLQLNSHNTSPLPADRFNKLYKKLI